MCPYSDGLPKEVRQVSRDIAEGTATACLKWGEEKAKSLLNRVIHNELAFVGSNETISDVKLEAKSVEWDLYNKYVKDGDLRVLIKMGMTLRRYELQGAKSKLTKLRDTITNSTHGTRGLHIAQFVQEKLLKEHISTIVDKSLSLSDTINSVDNMLRNIETRVTFVQTSDIVPKIVNQISTRLNANAPDTYFVFARDSALSKGRMVQEALVEMDIIGYNDEERSSKKQIILIYSKID